MHTIIECEKKGSEIISSEDAILSLSKIEEELLLLPPRDEPSKFVIKRNEILPNISDPENVEITETVSSLTSSSGQVNLTRDTKPINFDVSVFIRNQNTMGNLQGEFSFEDQHEEIDEKHSFFMGDEDEKF